jgi:ATP-binding cassette, subfamily D (ALD), member 3
MKYNLGAVVVGYAVVGLPVFGAGREEYLKRVGNQASNITKDYVRNSSLLINLAKVILFFITSFNFKANTFEGYRKISSVI